MKLERRGEVVELTARPHIDAYLADGWTEVVSAASAPAPAEEAPKKTRARK